MAGLRDEYDVIVVGAGGSGLAAACTAAQQGARVLVLEKQPQPGGTTGIAVGSYTAAQTRLQRQAGIDDDPRDHHEDAGKFPPADLEARNDAPLRRFFLQEAAKTLEWLEQLGLSFVGPSPEPPNRVPRMHNVVPGAKAYIAALQIELQKQQGTLICDAAVERLLVTRSAGSTYTADEGQDENAAGASRVEGVEVRLEGSLRTIRARRGVILAAGDYANDPELIARHKGDRFRDIEGINPHAGGDGHRLVEQAGGQLVNMDITYGPELRFIASRRRPFQQWLPVSGPAARWIGRLAARLPTWVMKAFVKRLLVTWQHPEDSLFNDGAILVNQAGERFVDETRWPEREIAVARQPGKIAYLLLDGRCCTRYSNWPHFISTAPDIAYAYVEDYLRLRPDVAVRSDTLDQLARRRQLDPDTLAATRDRFNRFARGEAADPLGRTERTEPIDQGPYVLLGPVKAYFTTTEGGARINQQLQVLDTHDRPIDGLYAVGQNGLGGMVLWGHGLHIAWAMTSGRLAGIAVAREA